MIFQLLTAGHIYDKYSEEVTVLKELGFSFKPHSSTELYIRLDAQKVTIEINSLEELEELQKLVGRPLITHFESVFDGDPIITIYDDHLE